MRNVLNTIAILSASVSLGNAFTTSSSPSSLLNSSPSRSNFLHRHEQQYASASSRSSSSSQLGMGVDGIQEAWAAYNTALEADPLIVKSITASVILGAADLAGQSIEKARSEDIQVQNSSIDIARTIRFAFFGLVLQAPWNHFYYTFLDGALPPTEDPFTATTGIKVVIDQFVQAPIFTVLIFAFLGFLEGKNFQSVKQQLDDDYVDTMLANCKLKFTEKSGPWIADKICSMMSYAIQDTFSSSSHKNFFW